MLDLRIAKLIGDIYAGVHEPERWDDALTALRDITDAQTIFVARMDMRLDEPEFTKMVGPETSRLDNTARLHREETYQIDPGLYYAIRNPGGGNFKLSEARQAESPDLQEWKKFQLDGIGSIDHHSRYTAPIDGLSFCLALHAKASDGLVSPRQELIHGLAFEHMSNAVRLAARPPDLIAGERAYILVDSTARIRQLSDAAEAILASNDGLSVRNRRLWGADANATRAVHAALHSALRALETGECGRCLAIARPSGQPDYLVKIMPMPAPAPPFDAVRPAALVQIVARDEPPNCAEPSMLVELFGLTRREAELASRFSGPVHDLPSAARALGVSHETARAHLRNVFDKCEVSSQLELVQLLARLA